MSKRKDVAPLRVMELFAGVGGFRQGMSEVLSTKGEPYFEVVWSNQFEPSKKKQTAALIYKKRWGEYGFVNRDINEVLADQVEMKKLADTHPDMLVAGFPCQDYSVAKPANLAEGIQGKKGVLWWSIYELLKARSDAGQPIKYALLENVDRLINSPSKSRGKDFAIILASLQSLGYFVEWRVVNSADYGFPQRRKRVFIVASHLSTKNGEKMLPSSFSLGDSLSPEEWILQNGVLASALPVVEREGENIKQVTVPANILEAQELYGNNAGKSPFKSAGVCCGGMAWTISTKAADIVDFSEFVGTVEPQTLRDVVSATIDVPESFFINDEDKARWLYLKGAKANERMSAIGFSYKYSEGAMSFPDRLDKAARTIITSEGGSAASRTKHAIEHNDGRIRRLVPEEIEALTGFPRGFTAIDGVSSTERAFLMGNALVTGVVRLIGQSLQRAHSGGN
jgi:DNA (cytosine-5)-methyltransferase 1